MPLISEEGDKQAVTLFSPIEMVFYRTTKIIQYIILIGVECFYIPCGETVKRAIGCLAIIILNTVKAIY